MKNGIPLKIEDYICEDGQIYFIASEPCVFMRYDNQSGQISVLLDCRQTIDIARAFARIIKHYHKVYFIPCYADNIYCYNLMSKQFYSLNISDILFQKMPRRKIIEAVRLGEYIYCVCRSPHLVLVIDPKTDRYEVVYYNNSNITEEHDFFTPQIKGVFIEYPFLHNIIIRFDTIRKKFCMKKICDKESGDIWDYISYFLDDHKGYTLFCNYKGEAYKVKDVNVAKIIFPRDSIKNYQNLSSNMEFMISGMISVDGNIYFIFADDCRILRYHIPDESFEWIEGQQWQRSEKETIHYDICKCNDNTLYVYRYDDDMLYIWNLQRNTFDAIEVTITGDVAGKLQLRISNYESDCTDLDFYTSYIQNFENDYKRDRYIGNIGKIIHDFI